MNEDTCVSPEDVAAEELAEEQEALDGDIYWGYVNELHSRFQTLLATGRSIHQRHPEVLEALFSSQEQAFILSIAERIEARWKVIGLRRKNIDLS